jgi:hypothetical protein
VQSLKEEVKDTESVDSTVEKKYKIHFKGVKAKDSLKSDADWKKLCSSNFDFVKQELESNKDPSMNAAKLAGIHDYTEQFKYQIIEKGLFKREDKLGQ